MSYHDNYLTIGQRFIEELCAMYCIGIVTIPVPHYLGTFSKFSVVPDVPHVLNILPVYSLDGTVLAAKAVITNNLTVSIILFSF